MIATITGKQLVEEYEPRRKAGEIHLSSLTVKKSGYELQFYPMSETLNLRTESSDHLRQNDSPKITGDRRPSDEAETLISPRQKEGRADSAMTRKASDAAEPSVLVPLEEPPFADIPDELVAPKQETTIYQLKPEKSFAPVEPRPTPPPIPEPIPPNPSKVRMVFCFDCETEIEEGKECPICAPLARAAKYARENARQYALEKQGNRIDQQEAEARKPHVND